MVRQHYGSDLGLSHEDMEYMLGPDSTPQSSRATKAGGEEHAGKRERPTSLRLPQVDSLSGSRKSPVGEEPQPTSSLPGGASMGTEGSRSPSSRHRLPDAPLDRNVLERGSKRLESPLERTAPDKGSKSPASPLERTTPDKWSKSPASPLERTTPDKWSKSPASPLDLNENEDRVTDGSSSESVDDADESVCPAPTQGRVYINRVFHTSAEKMFELLFMDSAFIQRFLEARKVTSVTNTPWQKDASGNMKRTLNYTITINNPLIGKFTTATESQTLYSDKHGGQHYLVDAEVYTHDVPYHDYFYTLNRFCISHSTKHKCHLRVYTDVKYKKQPWGFVKSFITKNSWSGLGDYFRHLEEELLEEEAELMQLSVENQATGVRRRRRPHGRSVPEHFNPNKQYGAEADPRLERIPGTRDRKGPQKWNISMMVAVMSSILLILTVLNMGLFLKLWAMEDVAQRMYLSTKQRLRERPESSVNPDVGSHQHLPDRSMEETQLLRSVLQDSIHLLEQLRSSLVLLQQSFQEPNVTARSR